VPEGESAARAAKFAAVVGLEGRLGHRPSQLSGGQQQRAAIARALATDPTVILADEPTGNLDTATSVEIMKLFADLHKRGKTIVMVTHEPDIAEWAEHRLVLRDGRILETA
jgi:putative ABC transport system ATP-binding protein